MAALTISEIHLVKGDEDALLTAPAAEAGTVATPYYRLNTTSGQLEKGNATNATELGNVAGVLIDDAVVGMPATIVLLDSNALLDLGDALDALAFNAPVYVSDTDATLADSAGTTARVAGRVVPGFANTAADKLLMLRST